MTNEIHPANSAGNGGYEHSDIGVRGVLYFLAGLAVAVVVSYFAVMGLYSYLDKRTEKQQAAVNPLVTDAPADTRHVPKEYTQGAFPDPRLEEDERGQLNGIRLTEEQTLSTYDYIDKNAGTVRIPIDRAMDLIAQRGLPVRGQNSAMAAATATTETTAPVAAPTAVKATIDPKKKKKTKK
jgi:hypothetical protein